MTTGVPWPDVAWLLAVAAMTVYLLFGGADFGGGVWDLFSWGRDAQGQRQAIAQAMGPVWEANHVWLLFLLILLFTGFPAAFHELMVGLYLPLNLILLGIILRGAAFVFRAHGRHGVGRQSPWGSTFGAASSLTVVLLGAALAAVSTAGPLTAPWRSWLSPFALWTGLFALAATAYLAAAYLTLETSGGLRATFRKRALLAGGLAGLAAIVDLGLAYLEAPRLLHRLLSPGVLGLVLLVALLGVGSYVSLRSELDRLGRFLAASALAVLLWSWAAAQWPYIIYPGFPVTASAAPDLALRQILTLVPFGLALLLPSLWLLLHVFKGRLPIERGGRAGPKPTP